MRKLFLALVAGLALMGGSPAWAAAPVLDFTVPANNPGADITYNGTGGPLVGSSITIEKVEGLSTPANNNTTFTINGGVLAFTTGNFTGLSGTILNFGGGGSVTITGEITALGIGAGTTLLSGTMTSAQVAPGLTGDNVVIGFFINTVNATLANAYGLTGGPTVGWSGSMNIGFNTTSLDLSAGFHADGGVTSGDVKTTPIPEPSSFALAGLGALGLIGYGLRRRKGA